MVCSVYGLHSGDGQIRYVGQTTRSVEARLRKHRENARLGVKTALYHWMRREATVVAVVLEENAEYSISERGWIANLRGAGARLLNHTEGGDGTLGWKHTPETTAKMLAKRIGRKPNLSPEERLRRAEQARFMGTDPAIKAKMAESLRGRKLSPEAIAKRTATRHANGGYAYTDEKRAAQSARIKQWWAQRKETTHVAS